MKLNKNIIKKVAIFLSIIILMLILAWVYKYMLEKAEQRNLVLVELKKENEIFNMVQNDVCSYVDLFTIYGNHLNITGHIDENAIDNGIIESIKLSQMDIDGNSTDYDLKYSVDNGRISFKLSDNINEGINLDKVNIGRNFLFLKINYTNEDKLLYKYYSLNNNSEYKTNDYYTLTKDNLNNRVEINFKIHDLTDEQEIQYMQIKVEQSTLPANTYDIVIDAGHGGDKSPGATYKGMREADKTLELSMLLKEKLEEAGFKVKATRTTDEYVESYGNNGRATIPYKTKAKLVLSIHLNSTVALTSNGGVEIYAPNHCNLSLAKSFADKIVNNTNGRYSDNTYSRTEDGVYVRTYNEDEIKEAIEYAHELEYEPYENLSTETPYLFMIRETGGIMTRAYIDGRNKYELDNPYKDSNIAAEAYLLELGFINSEFDLERLENNKEDYIRAIVDSIIENYQ